MSVLTLRYTALRGFVGEFWLTKIKPFAAEERFRFLEKGNIQATAEEETPKTTAGELAVSWLSWSFQSAGSSPDVFGY